MIPPMRSVPSGPVRPARTRRCALQSRPRRYPQVPKPRSAPYCPPAARWPLRAPHTSVPPRPHRPCCRAGPLPAPGHPSAAGSRARRGSSRPVSPAAGPGKRRAGRVAGMQRRKTHHLRCDKNPAQSPATRVRCRRSTQHAAHSAQRTSCSQAGFPCAAARYGWPCVAAMSGAMRGSAGGPWRSRAAHLPPLCTPPCRFCNAYGRACKALAQLRPSMGPCRRGRRIIAVSFA